MKILVIEDEYHTAKDLAKTIKAINPDAQIEGIVDSIEEALEFLNSGVALDLIFSDIELGDGLSFEIFQKTKNTIPVIFCTAYNQYALDAFKSVGIDYILKPFTKNSVLKALERFENLRTRLSPERPQNDSYDFLIEALRKSSGVQQSKSIVVQVSDKIIPVEISQIALFFIENGITYAYTFEQKKFPVNEKLKVLESSFAPMFFRANKQVLVNKSAIKDATHSFNRHLSLNLNIPFEERIIIGKLKMSAFIEWLSQN
jgi:DNA-binding LytR/AlgR family response regulator